MSGGRRLTALNEDLFAGREIEGAEHISVPSSADGRPSRTHRNRTPCWSPSRVGLDHSNTGSFLNSSSFFGAVATAMEYPDASCT